MKPPFWARYLLATATLALLLLLLDRLSPTFGQTSIALLLVLFVVSVAVLAGRSVALFISIAAGLAFNYFFLPPLHTFRIAHPQDVTTFAVLVTTAVIVGQLSSRAKKRALQAERRKQQLESAQEQVSAKAAEAEALRNSEQLKTALLDAVTHDLRSPLTSIKAAVTTLRTSELGDEGRAELLEVIEEETDRLNRFIQAMMDLAQLEAGQLRPVASEVTAIEIMEDALNRAATELSGRSVELQVSPDLRAVRVDPRLISQVLFTLLENAAKYSPQFAPVELRAEAAGRSSVRFSVIDHGSGIPAALRQRVFDKFFSGGSNGSLGLGLTIARGIIESHGGKIWIESGPGDAGTSVQFEIPGAFRSE